MSELFKRQLSKNYMVPVWISLFSLLRNISYPSPIEIILAIVMFVGAVLMAQKKFIGIPALLVSWLGFGMIFGYELLYTYINKNVVFGNPDFYPQFLIISAIGFVVSIGMLIYLAWIFNQELKQATTLPTAK